MKNGAWALALGKDGYKFKVTEDERCKSIKASDPVVVGAILRGFAIYKNITKDKYYDKTANKAFNFLVKNVDLKTAKLKSTTDQSILNLRSNPSAYNFLLLEAQSL